MVFKIIRVLLFPKCASSIRNTIFSQFLECILIRVLEIYKAADGALSMF